MSLSIEPTKAIATPLDWAALCGFEPLLAQLESIIARADIPQTMPDYWRSWSSYKRQIQHLAGWDAINPALRSEEAYNVASDRLLHLFEQRAAEIAEAN